MARNDDCCQMLHEEKLVLEAFCLALSSLRHVLSTGVRLQLRLWNTPRLSLHQSASAIGVRDMLPQRPYRKTPLDFPGLSSRRTSKDDTCSSRRCSDTQNG